jgi:hypothetical protein
MLEPMQTVCVRVWWLELAAMQQFAGCDGALMRMGRRVAVAGLMADCCSLMAAVHVWHCRAPCGLCVRGRLLLAAKQQSRTVMVLLFDTWQLLWQVS